MSVTLINGDGNPKVLASQDSDWYATITEQTTSILKVNGNLAATVADSNTIEIASGVCVSKEGRRVQIDSGQIVEIVIPTGTQGVDTYYIIGFHLYINDEGTQVAETFCETMESASATIAETTFKEGSSSIYLSLYRVKREGLSLTSVSRIVPLMDLPSHYIANHEAGATTSQAYSKGQYFTHNGVLKKVTSAIASGGDITTSNTSETDVCSEISQINTDLSANSSGAVTNMVWANQHINSLSKNGNVVTAIFGGYMSTPISVTDDTVLCKIPEGYRPKREIFCSGFRATTSSGTREFGIFRITANGEVHSQTGTQLTIGVMRVFGSWGV